MPICLIPQQFARNLGGSGRISALAHPLLYRGADRKFPRPAAKVAGYICKFTLPVHPGERPKGGSLQPFLRAKLDATRGEIDRLAKYIGVERLRHVRGGAYLLAFTNDRRVGKSGSHDDYR